MKYFVELLESYSKLKKRKLTLLSEASKLDPAAVKKANDYINKAKKANPPGTKVPVAEVPGASIWAAQDPKKKENKGKAVFDGLPGRNGRAMNIEPGAGGKGALYAEFVKLLGGGQQASPTDQPAPEAQGETPPAQPQDPNAAAGMAPGMMPPPTDVPSAGRILDAMKQGEVIKNIREAKKKAPGLFSFLQGTKLFDSADSMASYFVGGRGQSLEKKLSNTSNILVQEQLNAEGKLEYSIQGQQPIEEDYLIAYSEAMKKFFDIFQSGETPIEERLKNQENVRFLTSTFAINNDEETITIYPKGDQDKGFVIKDTFTDLRGSKVGVLRKVLKEIAKNFEGDVDFKRIDIKEEISKGMENYVRGVLLEHFMAIAIYQREANNSTNPPEVRKSYETLLQKYKTDQTFNKNLAVLSQLNENWMGMLEQATLSEDEAPVAMALSQLLNGGQMARVAVGVNRSVMMMAPKMMIPAGLDTGPGKKRDMIMVFDPKNPRAPKESVLVQVSVTDPEYAPYIQAGILREGEFVKAYSVGFKHYLDKEDGVDFTAGGSTLTSTNELAAGVKIAAEKGVDRSQLVSLNNSQMIGGPEARRRLKGFVQGIEKDIKNIDSLSLDNVNPKNNRKTDNITRMADSLVTRLKQITSFKERMSDSDHANLLDAAETFLRAKVKDKQEAGMKFKETVKATLMSLQIRKGLDKVKEDKYDPNDPDLVNSKNMIISQINACGRSVEEGHGSLNRVLGAKAIREYQFKQNDIMDILVGSVKSFPKQSNNGLKMVPNKNGRDYEFVDSSGKVVGHIKYQKNKKSYFVKYTESLIQSLGIKPRILDKSVQPGLESVKPDGKQKLVEMFIEAQRKILETLIELQKESVVK